MPRHRPRIILAEKPKPSSSLTELDTADSRTSRNPSLDTGTEALRWCRTVATGDENVTWAGSSKQATNPFLPPSHPFAGLFTLD